MDLHNSKRQCRNSARTLRKQHQTKIRLKKDGYLTVKHISFMFTVTLYSLVFKSSHTLLKSILKNCYQTTNFLQQTSYRVTITL